MVDAAGLEYACGACFFRKSNTLLGRHHASDKARSQKRLTIIRKYIAIPEDESSRDTLMVTANSSCGQRRKRFRSHAVNDYTMKAIENRQYDLRNLTSSYKVIVM